MLHNLESSSVGAEKIREMYPDASPTDYVFMPQYPNRTTALNTYRRIFNHFLDSASLKRDKDGNPRSPYSLRHYALQTRLRKSEGEVNIAFASSKTHGRLRCLAGLIVSVNSGSVVAYSTALGYANMTVSSSA